MPIENLRNVMQCTTCVSEPTSPTHELIETLAPEPRGEKKAELLSQADQNLRNIMQCTKLMTRVSERTSPTHELIRALALCRNSCIVTHSCSQDVVIQPTCNFVTVRGGGFQCRSISSSSPEASHALAFPLFSPHDHEPGRARLR